MSKILIVGNHSCANRGDLAILRGLVEELKRQEPKCNLTVLTREYESSKMLLKESYLVKDPLQGEVKSFLQKVSLRFEVFFTFLLSFVSKEITKKLLSKRQRKFASLLEEHDFVLQVGGSFFVDHYGISQFEYILISKLMFKRIYLVGHSYGPFRSFISKMFAKTLLSQVDANFYREERSKTLLIDLGIPNIAMGADTAWLVEAGKSKSSPSKTIALTLRSLYPFDKDLGVTQEQFEKNVCSLLNKLIERGFEVKIFSTCTNIGGYWKDDRVIGENVKRLVDNKNAVDVVKAELTDLEIGRELQSCLLTLGTRLHSAIISMNFGTPAFTIFYEHKSLGIIQRVLGPEYCLEIKELDSDNVINRILTTLDNITNVRSDLLQRVEEERSIAKKMIQSILANEKALS